MWDITDLIFDICDNLVLNVWFEYFIDFGKNSSLLILGKIDDFLSDFVISQVFEIYLKMGRLGLRRCKLRLNRIFVLNDYVYYY